MFGLRRQPLGVIRSLPLVVLLLANLLNSSGCQKSGKQIETVPVSGTVVYEGQPVPQGSLMFVPIGGGPTGQANVKADGSFTAGTYHTTDGLVPGDYLVTFVGSMEKPTKEAESLLPEDVKSKARIVPTIPDRYGDEKKSGLKASVKKGEKNTIAFELIK